jgi:hypothetical protein
MFLGNHEEREHCTLRLVEAFVRFAVPAMFTYS